MNEQTKVRSLLTGALMSILLAFLLHVTLTQATMTESPPLSRTQPAQATSPARLCIEASILTGDIVEPFPATIAVDPLPSGESGHIQGDARWCGEYDTDTQVDLRIVEDQLQDRQFAYWEGDGNLDNAESRSITVSVSADQTLHLNAWYYTPRSDGPRVAFIGEVSEFQQSINSWVAQVEVTNVRQGPLSTGQTVPVSYGAAICPDRNSSPVTDVPVEVGDAVNVSGLKIEDHVSIQCAPDRFTLDEPQDRDPSSELLSEYDANGNCHLDNPEFLTLVDDWTNKAVKDSLFFEGVDAWVNQADICQTASAGQGLMLTSVGTRPLASGDAIAFRAFGQNVTGMQVAIYGVSGERIMEGQTSGSTLRWDLRTRQGAPVANGVYLYRVTAEGPNGQVQRSEIRKLLVLR